MRFVDIGVYSRENPAIAEMKFARFLEELKQEASQRRESATQLVDRLDWQDILVAIQSKLGEPSNPSIEFQDRHIPPPSGLQSVVHQNQIEMKVAPPQQSSLDSNHLGTHWEIRRMKGTFEDPERSLYSRSSLIQLSIPLFQLQPEQEYSWRVSFDTETGPRTSTF